MESRISLVISLVAVFISLSTFLYSFYVNEFGILVGNDDYVISIKDRLEINNTHAPLTIKPHLTISNNGTNPLRLHKIRALMQLGAEHHIFTSTFTKTIPPHEVWNDEVVLGEKLTIEETKKRDQLGLDIVNYMLQRFHATKDPNKPIFLNNDLMQRIGNVLEENTSWMKEDDNYYLLLLFWVNNDERTPSEKQLYKFDFNTWQKKLLTDSQNKGYLTPYSGTFSSNKFILYGVYTYLKKIEDSTLVTQKYSEYYKLAIN